MNSTDPESPVPGHSKLVPANAPKVMLELRPALEGFAGIPQETRLLYRGLQMIDGLRVQGMVQTFALRLGRGTLERDSRIPRRRRPDWRINRYSRLIVSMAEKPYRTLFDKILDRLVQRFDAAALSVTSMLGTGTIRLTDFDPTHFADFVWRTLFSKTLPASDFGLVTKSVIKVCSVPWNLMHRAGLNSLNLYGIPRYPRLDTRGIDIFIAQTPYPARVSAGTTLVVRYHDALPVLMPHTIPDKATHQASHFYALSENVRAGAYFACISEATRQDLLRMFPEMKDRAVTIHNMVSHHYFLEDSPKSLVGNVIRSRLYEGVKLQPEFFTVREKENFYKRCLGDGDIRYLLIVSTIEPRKNHARLLAAWEVLKAEVDPKLKLVVVGTLGWDNSQLTDSFRSWIDRGDLFMLHAVPAPDLRLLYRHAAATVCPSLGEGFDYSGVEAMASGGVAISSDIPVHREIYEEASLYFDPYSTASLVKALRTALYADDAAACQAELRRHGAAIAARYQPDQILPQWSRFIERLTAERRRP